MLFILKSICTVRSISMGVDLRCMRDPRLETLVIPVGQTMEESLQ